MSLHRRTPPAEGTFKTRIVNRDKEILMHMLGLQNCKIIPLDLTTMLYISTPSLEDELPNTPEDLPNAFLRRLWLYDPQARSPTCQVPAGVYGVARPEMDEDSQSAVNPLDLVAAMYMSTNSFLRQEITHRMVQCNFAVPLFLPPVWPELQGTLLLCPFRGVLGQWRTESAMENRGFMMKNMADSRMPLISAVRLGSCGVSKSRVLNRMLGGPHKQYECFTHRHLQGGKLPRILSEGMVEVGWNLPPGGNHHSSAFSHPVLVANLRGDAAESDKQLSLLCYSSAVLIVFCGKLEPQDQELLASWRGHASHMILIDCLMEMEEDGEEVRSGNVMRKVVKGLELPEGSVLHGNNITEEELAENLRNTLNHLIPHLHAVNLVGIAGVANDLDLTVDEDEICRMAFFEVEEILKGMENGITKYIDEQLPLQGSAWKRLGYLEKEESRLKEDFDQQQLTQGLRGEQEGLIEVLLGYKLTTAMRAFIEALCTLDSTKRAFLLTWMKVKLEVLQLDQLSAITGPEREQLQEPCLGLEHFLREMGLIYERYFRSPNSDLYDMFRLPYLAGELLLYGVPLEIYDGDASIFPMNWVYSVLYEVYRQLPKFSRMRVLTTLGFHSSKNPEVLSALFGVNFPKHGRRTIKGAYMLLITLPDNLRQEMDCEFLMLISTEGLNPPEQRQEENSFVHDNELATFVAGLSDVTLVNLPPDGQGETRNNLQIAVSTLLRTRDTERVPIFQTASEGTGIDAKLMSSVIQILAREDALDGSETERPASAEKSLTNHSLVGPWTTPSSTTDVNPKYSDAALELKQSLLEAFRKRAMTTKPTCLGAFMEHMCTFWESVKSENFPIGFRNTEVADTLCSLCIKLVEGEQMLKNHVDLWSEGVDQRIAEIKETSLQSGNPVDSQDIVRMLKEEIAVEMKAESDKVRSSLWDHLRQEDLDMNLVEAYKADIFNRVDKLQEQVTCDMDEKLESAVFTHDLEEKLQALLTALEAALEVKLRSLLQNCKNNDAVMEDNQLEEEFYSVWNDIPFKLNQPLETHEVTARVIEQLKENLNNRGLKKQKVKLKNPNRLKSFTVKNGHFALRSKMKRTLKHNKEVAQRHTNTVIESCDVKVSEKLRRKESYSDSYLKELLGIVDKGLEGLKTEMFEMKPKFEVDIKTYICSKACVSFQEMQQFLTLEKETKERYLSEKKEEHLLNFIYHFRKRDQCQKAALAFTSLCLKPAALNFIYGTLERQILDDILRSDNAQHCSSSHSFHYSTLRELMLEDSFEGFFEYLLSGESFSRKKIEHIVMDHLSGSVMIEECREPSMQEISNRMKSAIDQVSEGWSGMPINIRALLEKICDSIETPGDINISRDALNGPLFEITTHRENFVACLQESVADMTETIAEEHAENEDVIEVPEDLSFRLQDLLYDRVRGCEQQCPFCKAPCNLREGDHTVHQALLHRPKGLVSYTCADSTSLSHSSCSADVHGENQFKNRDTGGQSVYYKDYRSIYPDWTIAPEEPGKDESNKYWKYVLAKYNSRFAQEYQCEPALLPEDWNSITKEEALESLRVAFYMEIH